LTRIFAAEFEGSGVSFLTADPGEMDTQMHAEAIPEADRSLLGRSEEVARILKALIEAYESIPSGSRVVLSKWKELQHEFAGSPLAS
jgi:hypothetical protein